MADYQPIYSNYTLDGNTVRKRIEKEKEEERIREARRRRNARLVRKNQARALSMSLTFVAFLGILCIIIVFMSVRYIQVRSNISATNKSIQLLQNDLQELRNSNDAMEAHIESSIDLNEIYRIATQELGMVYAGADQSVYYDQTESEYVRQYETIPVE